VVAMAADRDRWPQREPVSGNAARLWTGRTGNASTFSGDRRDTTTARWRL